MNELLQKLVGNLLRRFDYRPESVIVSESTPTEAPVGGIHTTVEVMKSMNPELPRLILLWTDRTTEHLAVRELSHIFVECGGNGANEHKTIDELELAVLSCLK